MDGPSYYGNTSKFIVPDLFIEAREGYTIDLFYYSRGTNFMKPEGAKNGDHLRNGIFGYHPKTSRINTNDMSVTDVMPIVLKYFNSE
jgi:predicted AlkP superfamily phosphohydrolase/phosphomutase